MDELFSARAKAIREARWCGADVRVATQQLVCKTRNPRLIERGR